LTTPLPPGYVPVHRADPLISRFAKEIIIFYETTCGSYATERRGILKNSEFTVKVLKLPNKIVDGKVTKCYADDFIKLLGLMPMKSA
jgi:hypothetical protein